MIRTCPHCGTANRVPPKHLASRGKCGNCHQALPPLDAPLDVNRDDFDAITKEARVPVLVDFWAAWCGPCRMVAPEVKKLAHNLAGRAVVLKVDTEAFPDVAARYRVQGIPNFVLFNQGRVIAQQAGAMNAAQLEAFAIR